MDKNISNFKHMTQEDEKIYGRHNKLMSINPNNCYFIAKYPDGKIIKGNNLFTTGWDNIPNGLSELSYVLSTGHIIRIPKFKAYLPLVEVSVGIEGSRVFHSINVKCLEENRVSIWKIILKQDNISKFKIGDVVIGQERLPKVMNKFWKYTN